MRLIITDVTEMHGGNYCVAGWDVQARRMVRPLPNGANWTAALLQQHGITPGASIDITPTGQSHPSAFPHQSEDTPVHPGNIQNVSAGPINWFARDAPFAYETVSEAFSHKIAHNRIWNDIRQGVYVSVGTRIGSLAAVRHPRTTVQFVQDFEKLKAILNDGSGCYKLVVSSLSLKTVWKQGGLAAVQRALPATGQLHIRLGLARAFGSPADKCYLMINGIYG